MPADPNDFIGISNEAISAFTQVRNHLQATYADCARQVAKAEQEAQAKAQLFLFEKEKTYQKSAADLTTRHVEELQRLQASLNDQQKRTKDAQTKFDEDLKLALDRATAAESHVKSLTAELAEIHNTPAWKAKRAADLLAQIKQAEAAQEPLAAAKAELASLETPEAPKEPTANG